MAWRATAVEVLDCRTAGRDHEAPRPVGVTKAVVDPSNRASSGMMLEAKGAMAAVVRCSDMFCVWVCVGVLVLYWCVWRCGGVLNASEDVGCRHRCGSRFEWQTQVSGLCQIYSYQVLGYYSCSELCAWKGLASDFGSVMLTV